MRRRIASLGLGAVLLVSPLLVSADIVSDLQGQIQALLAQLQQLQLQQQNPGGNTPAQGRGCPQLSRTLSRGMSGRDVADLQVYLGVSPTGFFGPLTAGAVIQFQSSEGILPIG